MIWFVRTDVEDHDSKDRDHDKHRLYKPVPADYESLIPAQLKKVLEFPGYAADNFSKLKQRFAELGGERRNVRHGWIRTRS